MGAIERDGAAKRRHLSGYSAAELDAREVAEGRAYECWSQAARDIEGGLGRRRDIGDWLYRAGEAPEDVPLEQLVAMIVAERDRARFDDIGLSTRFRANSLFKSRIQEVERARGIKIASGFIEQQQRELAERADAHKTEVLAQARGGQSYVR
jgi:hypothetical protein